MADQFVLQRTFSDGEAGSIEGPFPTAEAAVCYARYRYPNVEVCKAPHGPVDKAAAKKRGFYTVIGLCEPREGDLARAVKATTRGPSAHPADGTPGPKSVAKLFRI